MPVVLCFGDSNTYGQLPMERSGQRRRLGRAERWPGVMAAALGDSVQVIEEGLPGRTTILDDPIEGADRNGRRFLPAILETHAPVDLLVVMLGTNDHKARFNLSAEEIAICAGRLLDAARITGLAPRMLLVSPPRVLERGCLAGKFAGAEKRGTGLAGHMAAEAAARDVAFFDAAGVIESDPLDGVHFAAPAHATLGAAMAGQVTALLT